MPALRRILKYTPAVVLWFLMLVWVVSCVIDLGIWTSAFMLLIAEGSVDLICGFDTLVVSDAMPLIGPGTNPGVKLGHFYISDSGMALPLPLLATFLLPLAIGPFVSYRFRLWHCLAYTALLAVELAYYLRWQE